MRNPKWFATLESCSDAVQDVGAVRCKHLTLPASCWHHDTEGCLLVGVHWQKQVVAKAFSCKFLNKTIPPFYSVANLVVFLWFCPSQVSASEQSKKEASKAVIKTLFEERYKAGKNKWFFQKLRF